MFRSIQYSLWILFSIISLGSGYLALEACILKVPILGQIISACPRNVLISSESIMQKETRLLISELVQLQAFSARAPVCPEGEEARDWAISQLKEKIEGSGNVAARNVEITIFDHNGALDDYFDLYVNAQFIGHVENKAGGKTNFSISLQKGENLVELRPVKENDKGTELILNIEPGGFSKVFIGFKAHVYQVFAP